MCLNNTIVPFRPRYRPTHLARPLACAIISGLYPVIIGRNIARTHIQFLTRIRRPDAEVATGIINNRIANLVSAGKSR